MNEPAEVTEPSDESKGRQLPWLVRTKQAAVLTGLSESWLRREASLGNIPHVRIGGLRFDVDRLREWIRAQESRNLALPFVGGRHHRRA
jgi:hypothetical protein